MARRGFGGTALRAALGAVTGVAEGLQQRDVLAEQRRKDAEEAMFRRIQAGLMPVEDVLPQEQRRIGPLRGATPGGAPSITAPPASGTPAAIAPAPQAPMSAVQRVMGEFQGRAPRTVRIEGQRYAMQPTQQENMALNIALQQAISQDTRGAEAAQLEERAKALAAMPQFGGDINKARLVLGGADAGMLGIEAASPLQRRVSEANIRQSDAAAAASLAARNATNAAKSGAMTERDINEQIARYMQQDVILKDEMGQETRRPKTEQEVRQFAQTLRSIISTPTDFPSFEQWSSSAMNPFAKTAPKK